MLTSVEQLVPRNNYEWEALDLLKTRTYHHVRIFEPFFFKKTGWKADMTRAFSHMGWNNFADMKEPDSSILAKTYKYDRTTWWNEISKEPVSSKNSIVSIYHPTLKVLAKWIAMVVHPRSNLRLCSLPELQYLFAMAKKIKLSPVMSLLAHWLKMIAGKSPIDITTLVTHIATHVKALDNAQKKEPARHIVAGTTTRRQTRSSNQQQEQAGRYEHCWRNIRTRCSPGTLLPPGMQDSYGPQVGPSSSARYGYENPIMRGITDLTTRVNTMGQQHDQLSIDLAHNTDLTQQS
ncbi:hypothetical protein C2845_PM13G06730 [Panicum miliaceum]|uniref:Uncharacterized protein n=1 Tax=Panicum miliaceum TaxID=4540 RepID=A0A3L6RM37_PANMI|nr:hypothetical protein C2845_PM13G06730 [Panicum miliaceum]